MKRLLCIVLFCVLGSAGKSFALPPCPTSGVYDNCLGAWTFSGGETYFGEWKNDKRNGQGYFTTPDGETYVGEWKDDNRHGQGSASFPSGQTYVGEWKDDSRHGQGSATWSDGETYVGEFKDNKRHGQGSNIYPDGQTYVGEFKDNEPHHEEVVKTDAASDFAFQAILTCENPNPPHSHMGSIWCFSEGIDDNAFVDTEIKLTNFGRTNIYKFSQVPSIGVEDDDGLHFELSDSFSFQAHNSSSVFNLRLIIKNDSGEIIFEDVVSQLGIISVEN